MWIELIFGVASTLAGATSLRAFSVRKKKQHFESYLDQQMHLLIERFGYDTQDVQEIHYLGHVMQFPSDAFAIKLGFVYYHSQLLLDIINAADGTQARELDRLLHTFVERDAHGRIEATAAEHGFDRETLEESAEAYEKIARRDFSYFHKARPLFQDIMRNIPRFKMRYLLKDAHEKRHAKKETQKDWLKKEQARIEEERTRRFSLQTEAITLMRIVQGAEESFVQRIASQETKEAAEAMAEKTMTYEEIIILAAESSEQMVSAQFSADEPYQQAFLRGLVGDMYPVVLLRLMLAGFLIRHDLEAERTVPMLMDGQLSLPIDEEGFVKFMTELGLPLTVEPLPLPEPVVEEVEVEEVEVEPEVTREQAMRDQAVSIPLNEYEISRRHFEVDVEQDARRERNKILLRQATDHEVYEALDANRIEGLMTFYRKHVASDQYENQLMALFNLRRNIASIIDKAADTYLDEADVTTQWAYRTVYTEARRVEAYGLEGLNTPLTKQEFGLLRSVVREYVNARFDPVTTYTEDDWNDVYRKIRKSWHEESQMGMRSSRQLRELIYRYAIYGIEADKRLSPNGAGLGGNSAHLEMQRYIDKLVGEDKKEKPTSAYIQFVNKAMELVKPNVQDDVASILEVLEKESKRRLSEIESVEDFHGVARDVREAEIAELFELTHLQHNIDMLRMRLKVEEQRAETAAYVAKQEVEQARKRRLRTPLSEHRRVNFLMEEVKTKDETTYHNEWYAAVAIFLRHVSLGSPVAYITDLYTAEDNDLYRKMNEFQESSSREMIKARLPFVPPGVITTVVYQLKPHMLDDFLLKGVRSRSRTWWTSSSWPYMPATGLMSKSSYQ